MTACRSTISDPRQTRTIQGRFHGQNEDMSHSDKTSADRVYDEVNGLSSQMRPIQFGKLRSSSNVESFEMSGQASSIAVAAIIRSKGSLCAQSIPPRQHSHLCGIGRDDSALRPQQVRTSSDQAFNLQPLS